MLACCCWWWWWWWWWWWRVMHAYCIELYIVQSVLLSGDSHFIV